jgi:hypothetical protein
MVLLNFLVSLGQWAQEHYAFVFMLYVGLLGVCVYTGGRWVMQYLGRRGPRL